MNKIQVTAQQRANALEALNVMWPSVPPGNVYPNLSSWRHGDEMHGAPPSCGTVACFGGWCEWWPEFRRQMELDPNEGAAGWYDVTRLFGPVRLPQIDRLLNTRGGSAPHPADAGFTGTDHELVSNRLRWLIENSEVVG